MASSFSGKKQNYILDNQNREGDHICYYSDLRKMKQHYPAWDITRSLPNIFEEIAASWMARANKSTGAIV